MTEKGVFRFQYPPMVLFGLLAILAVSVIHTTYTYQTVMAMGIAQGGVADESWYYLRTMFVVVGALALYVCGAILARGKMQIRLVEGGLRLQRFGVSGLKAARIPDEEVDRVVVARAGRGWRIEVQSEGGAWRFPLHHVSEVGKPRERVSNKKSVEALSLVKALRARYGERVDLS